MQERGMNLQRTEDLKNIFLTSLLEYNCFTMLCQFLLYYKVNQLYVYIYPHMPSLLHLPPTLPIPPLQVVTKHRVVLPVLMQLLPTSYLFYIWQCIYVNATLSLRSSLHVPLPHVLKYTLSVCALIPVPPLGSSEPFFFFRFHIYVSIWYSFFSF